MVDLALGPVSLRDLGGEVVLDHGHRRQEAVVDPAEEAGCVRPGDDGVVEDVGLARLGDLAACVEGGHVAVDDVVADDPIIVGERGISVGVVGVLAISAAASQAEADAAAGSIITENPRPKPIPRAQSTITLFSTSVPREPFQK